jgi:hypothetical protein
VQYHITTPTITASATSTTAATTSTTTTTTIIIIVEGIVTTTASSTCNFHATQQSAELLNKQESLWLCSGKASLLRLPRLVLALRMSIFAAAVARRKEMISEAGILIATCFSGFFFLLVIINGASAHLREYFSHRSPSSLVCRWDAVSCSVTRLNNIVDVLHNRRAFFRAAGVRQLSSNPK